MNKYLLIVISILSINSLAFAQSDSTSFYTKWEPGFKSFQIDAVSIIFINSIGAAVDFDLVKIKRSHMMSLGVRLGAEYCYKKSGAILDLGGGDPKNITHVEFFDYNIYSRFTSDFKVVRLDFYLGAAFHHVSKAENSVEPLKKNNKFYPKAGMDFKLKINNNVGFLGKVAISAGETFGGLGIFIGYGKEN